MIGGGDDGRWHNRRCRHTIDGAPADRGGRMRMIRPGRGLYGTKSWGYQSTMGDDWTRGKGGQ